MKKSNFIKSSRLMKKICLIVVACTLNVAMVNAQVTDPDDPGDGGDLGGETTTVPFDGNGVIVLVTIGTSYGIARTYKTRSESPDINSQ